MKLIKSINLMQRVIKDLKKQYTIGFVPTMGFLHEGHISLIKSARKETEKVIVSIFINPIQFNDKKDFNKYPKNIQKDIKILEQENVDYVFLPQSTKIYPQNFCTYINIENLFSKLCGKSRQGHFQGVATIVLKLFNIIHPNIAYFGQKDAQQTIIIKKMVKDLNVDVKIKILSTIRENSGLALSSRNTHLSNLEKQQALCLYQSLKKAKDLMKKGIRKSNIIKDEMQKIISQFKNAKIDYIAIVNSQNLEDVDFVQNKDLIALAVKIGNTRLIDNIICNF
ncbi:MAG: pantoate--beta-alanine ligase [bacterium]